MKTVFSKYHIVSGITVAFIIAFTPIAYAAHYGLSLEDSVFEIEEDANLTVEVLLEDWGNIPAGAKTETKTDLPSGAGDDSFGKGSKEDSPVPTVVNGSIPPNKSDLKQFGLYLEDKGSGRFLHVFWTRVQDPSGATNMDFEINQNTGTSANGVTPVRKAGDYLLQYDLENGGTNPTLWLSVWLDGTEPVPATSSDCESSSKLPCWGEKLDLSQAGIASGSINSSPILAINSSGLGPLDPRTFGEASINFDLLSDVISGSCTSFGSVYLKSRSSQEFNSALKDFIAPISTLISNCASLKIIKKNDAGRLLGGVTFELFEDKVPYGTAPDDGGVTDGTEVLYTCTTAPPAPPEDDPNPNEGTCLIPNILKGHYWVIEDGDTVPTGHVIADPPYQALDIDLSVNLQTFTFENDLQRGTIIVKKQTLPDGSSQSFSFSPSWKTGFSLSDDGMNTSIDLLPSNERSDGGDYSVSETVPGGWDQTSAVCTDDIDQTNTDPSAITLRYNETVTCTFTNTKRGKIIIEKLTVPAGEPDSFTITGGTGSVSGSLSHSQTAELVVKPGNYTSVETVPEGWDLTALSCNDANSTGTLGTKTASFNVEAGETVKCTFTNTKKGAIIVEKLAPSYSSTDMFGFTGDITATLSHTGKSTIVYVVPGTYDVTEGANASWGLTNISCDDSGSISEASTGNIGDRKATFRVEAGETVTCTFTNTPLTNIEVKVDSLASGGTNSTITCTPTGGPVAAEDPSLKLENLAPGTYVCTVVVDGVGPP